MHNVEAAVEMGESTAEFAGLLTEFFNLSKRLPLENYLMTIERFVDRARESIEDIPDPSERDRLRQGYEEVVQYAIDLVIPKPC